jgi:uncharacterized protein (DUF1501 family)
MKKYTRREFTKRFSALSTLAQAAPFALNLAGIGASSAQSSASDYRAIVCLFMYGGNDQNNLIIPYDQTSYDQYASDRNGLELSRDTLLEITPTTSQGTGRRFAFPAEMSAAQSLFAQKKMAVLGNVGPLIVPTTLANFKARKNLPGQLFSHNDQTSTWQAYEPEGVRIGWGGRIADLLLDSNGDSTFSSISANGNAVLMSGNKTVQYQVSSSGAIKIAAASASSFGSSASAAALRALSMQGGSNLFEQDHAAIVARSFNAADKVTNALSSVATSTSGIELPTELADDGLGLQLQVILRMIASRSVFDAKRQVFFVSLGGFDTHDDQLTRQPALLERVSNAINYFYQGTESLGIADQVTLFTASDFGRTLASNGDGSDHAWGAHHLIVGGAVQGGDFYGSIPEVRIGTTANPHSLDTGGGRYIPTTAVDQYAVTLAKWMGVPSSDFATVAPNIGNFDSPYLNFL